MNIHFKVTDGDGAVIKEFNRFVPKGAGNYSVDAFSLKVYGVGKHTYTLTASISGEVEKSTATVEVEPTNGTELKQVNAGCSDLYSTWEVIDYHATLTAVGLFICAPAVSIIGGIAFIVGLCQTLG